MAKYYRTKYRIYKIDGVTLQTVTISFKDTIILEEQEYSKTFLEDLSTKLISILKGKEITKEEYDVLFNRLMMLRGRQQSVLKDIEEFRENYLSN